MKAKPITVMGIFVVDLAFRTKALPVWGETVMGAGFRLGPGGKGSNQSVAAARLGAKVFFISKVGEDNFADMAQKTYDAEGIDTRFLIRTQGVPPEPPASSCRSQAARTPLSSFPERPTR